jgi:uncharacterized LabA/DUF88 family protein
MISPQANYAFIDSQNLNLAVRAQGWKLDFWRFRTYLREKHGVAKAYLFIGYVSGNESLYAALQDAGFTCIFKPTLRYKDGTTKGNCDAELVLWSMIDIDKYAKAVIVTGDGDFHCLVDYLLKQDKLECVLIPDRERFSALLKFKQFRPHLRYMNDLRGRLELKERAPLRTEP